ncbi:hypothetical protein BT67DRAFT_446108 [Trichocladium antarcticum]|uniref:Thioesterase domain-containing protein n=1 Tax=Trichocladium antarcticum TaxID=1450529 RepID=A0AAN6ZA77_9PEZI|nr:hypothetical protein BT67DRAFT_446108 [Trichocladium antarcticum]
MSQPREPPKQAVNYLALAGEDRIRALITQFAAQAADPGGEPNDWTYRLFPNLTVHSTAPPSPAQDCNRLANLHGGCAATIFDFCTSTPLALVAKPGFWSYLGVSRTLNTTYLRPAPLGAEVRVECEIVQLGQRLCTLRGTMRRASDGAVLATCEHGKVNTDPVAKV